MCNRPEPFIINYARLDVINPFSGRSNFQCCSIAVIQTVRQCVRHLILDTRDVLDLPVEIL